MGSDKRKRERKKSKASPASARPNRSKTSKASKASARIQSRKTAPIKRSAPRVSRAAKSPPPPLRDNLRLSATPVDDPEQEARAEQQAPSFPIVGIGASAGGLEALESFLKHVPSDSSTAFVVVQHLDPTRDGMLVELLQRNTRMPVLQAHDRMTVEPDHVYVIPPNKDMSLLHGVLHLLAPAAPRGLNLPIDFFFRSLAEDQKHCAIGVILSGMGSDGTLGIRNIKEKGGATFAQALTSAKFDGMPKSAIDTGMIDVVAPVEDLPSKIIAYRQHLPSLVRPEAPIEDKTLSALEKICILLRAHTGNDFSSYKKSTIYRRVERRMGLHQLDNIEQYVGFLRENTREVELLFKELLLGVTSFFRDLPAWECLKTEVIPSLLAARSAGGVIRAWVPGCSTGEEAYSLAIVFREAMEPIRSDRNITLQIYATDLDSDAIERARQGRFPENIAADVSSERLRRYFVKDDSGYRVNKEIRSMVLFALQNVISDPPFTKLDILSCRNLLIYLSSELQKKLIPLFHYSLNPGGALFLGTAETIGAFTSLFKPFDPKVRIYRRVEQGLASVPIEFPLSAAARRNGTTNTEAELPAHTRSPPPNLQTLADRVLVQRFSPVAVLCNDRGDLLYVSGRTGKYLEPAVGKANLNIFAMAREGLRLELSRGFHTALREDRVITLRGVNVGTNGGKQTVDLAIQKLVEPRELRDTVMIVFTDVRPRQASQQSRSHRRAASAREHDLETMLERMREEVQITREEMQASQEELRSTNEELQSTNEELQSSNEELTTSKEEMQSLNEELQTVNNELQAKIDQLSRSNNDMKNLLDSTEIATLFLDAQLNVRRFTSPTARIIKLIPADVGRPVTDIASDLEDSTLVDDAREVLRSLVFKEKQVATRDGRWFTVRILPYRTVDNVIDGVVITFTDSKARQTLQTALDEQTHQNLQMSESLPVLIWTCRPDGACDYLSKQWTDYTGIRDSGQLGHGWLEQLHPDERNRVRDGWKAAVEAKTEFKTEFRLRDSNGEYRWFETRLVPIRDAQGALTKWYGMSIDVDAAKRTGEARR